MLSFVYFHLLFHGYTGLWTGVCLSGLLHCAGTEQYSAAWFISEGYKPRFNTSMQGKTLSGLGVMDNRIHSDHQLAGLILCRKTWSRIRRLLNPHLRNGSVRVHTKVWAAYSSVCPAITLCFEAMQRTRSRDTVIAAMEISRTCNMPIIVEPLGHHPRP